MIIKSYFIIFTIVILQSCNQNNHVQTYRLQKSAPSPQIKIINNPSSNFSWVKPEGWIPSSGSSMRLASFEVPFKGGVGDLSVIKLAGAGGGLEPNINRWRNQLNLDPQTLSEINKEIIKKAGKLGEYKMIKIINIQNNSAFLAAIIPIANQTLFIKLSADPSGVQESEFHFVEFCSSIHFSH